MEEIVIIGSGGLGRKIIEEVRMSEKYKILGFIDDNKKKLNAEINGFKVIGNIEYIMNYPKEINVLVCIGEPSIKKNIIEKLEKIENIKLPNFISIGVTINEDLVKLGKGNIICMNTIVSVNVEIGDYNLINFNNIVSHDTKIGNNIIISPSCTLCGNVIINDDVFIGAGAIIRENSSIEKNTIVGIGSVVTKSIGENKIVYGSPCKEHGENINKKVFK